MKSNGIIVKSSAEAEFSLHLPFNKMGIINYPLQVIMKIK